ncbi:ARM repeat-containing protein [Eremomyces bilateralis CBS 781.70]|uniref:ARM repeat-containing protein n=1 Tax=Eremomyces bilateralis CBS 781.70 TaxID=1392243 RepID=A0A6G1FZ37_9PEZI|nr:ARM repeat-containing protein [Eremomyces bilateralis CBS 781.70]KAF1810936.1 ARM repeat-containing protein [Eremomyces bilateralis CBS 781.70]
MPVLRTRDMDGNSMMPTTNMDVLGTRPGNLEMATNGIGTHQRHRHGQQSLPVNNLRPLGENGFQFSSVNGSGDTTPTKTGAINRHSLDAAKYTSEAKRRNSLLNYQPSPQSMMQSTTQATPGTAHVMPKIPSSFSTNDVPTLNSFKKMNGFTQHATSSASQGPAFAPSRLEKTIHPTSSRALVTLAENNIDNNIDLVASFNGMNLDEGRSVASHTSSLQASAAPFGPSVSKTMTGPSELPPFPSPPEERWGEPELFNPPDPTDPRLRRLDFNRPANVTWPAPATSRTSLAQPPFNYQPPFSHTAPNQFHDSQAQVIALRRAQNSEDNARWNDVALTDLIGQIWEISRDQHGCRFLQRRIEEGDADEIAIIFGEVKDHIFELMTDQFGNYLCQRLLENGTEDQRTELIRNVSPQMIQVGYNQHGTRALQKMIEFVDTPEQVHLITEALRDHVCKLIQDINGNHVVQKCLNHMSHENSDFIYEAIGNDMHVVGTHRHGCCVIQRCLDHASTIQKNRLVKQISEAAYTLVQDPFGNYVLQYVLDIGEVVYTDYLCRVFVPQLPVLSRQKFSSNVIEKCIRCSSREARNDMIEVLLNPRELESLIKDNYGNYVIQTAMEHSESETRTRLYDAVRPMVSSIRGTPHGRRIIQKLTAYDNRNQNSRQLPFTTGAMAPTISPSTYSVPAQAQTAPHPPPVAQHPSSNFASGYPLYSSAPPQYYTAAPAMQGQPVFGLPVAVPSAQPPTYGQGMPIAPQQPYGFAQYQQPYQGFQYRGVNQQRNQNSHWRH